CHVLGQTDDTVLGRRVGGHVRRVLDTGIRRDVDDASAAGLEHGGDLVLEAQEGAAKVDRDHSVELVGAQFVHITGRVGDAGVVDGEIEASVCADGVFDHRGYVGFAGDI